MSELLRNNIFIPTVIEIKRIKTNSSCYNLYTWGKNIYSIYCIYEKCTKQWFNAIIFCVSNKVNDYYYCQFETNYYLLLFKFVACPAGYVGLNCSAKCNASSYGLGCAKSCECDPCHHVIGCNLTMNAQGKDDQISLKSHSY